MERDTPVGARRGAGPGGAAERRPREVLDVAALTGTRVEAAAAGGGDRLPASVLDELLASGLLVGDGAWLRFRHEIARLAVAQAVAGAPPRRRSTAGSWPRCALGRDDDARLAFHAEAAGDGAAVLQYAPRAARRAARLASHREAAAQYERALRFAGRRGTGDARRAVRRAGLRVALLDRWARRRDARERALALWREAGDRLREGDTLRRLSRTCGACAAARGDRRRRGRRSAILEPLGPGAELAGPTPSRQPADADADHAPPSSWPAGRGAGQPFGAPTSSATR